MKNVGNGSRGRSQGVMNIFRAPYRAHCAVIFATAQLSCMYSCCYQKQEQQRLAVGPGHAHCLACLFARCRCGTACPGIVVWPAAAAAEAAVRLFAN